MLQLAAVLTTGGFLLFSSAFPIDISLFTSIVNQINDAKNKQANFIFDSLRVNYLYDAILGLIYVIAWRKQIQLDFPDKLLKSMCLQWKNAYQKITWKNGVIIESPDFKIYWQRAFQAWKDFLTMMQQQNKGKMASFDSKKNKNKKQQPVKIQRTFSYVEQPSNKKQESQQQNRSEGSKQTALDDQLQNLSPRQRFLRSQQNKKKQTKSPKKDDEKSQKSQKQQRVWIGSKVSKKQMQSLDRSKIRNSSPPPHRSSNIYHEDQRQQKLMALFYDSDKQDEQQVKKDSFLNKWVGKLKNVVGDKKITRQDLNQVLNDFKQSLMQKNVAQQVAVKITEAVGQTLLDSKTKTFTSVQKTVKQAMKQTLRKILTPKRKIDLVVEVAKQKQKLKPYVIVFIGVNGVGKSTNLAKVAYKLKNAGLSVLLAACDNFRAGAVQQIQTHGRNLDIPVFQKGYKQQPANIAYQAIKDATKKHIDAVLVDTAGRMQDNTPLMKQLARLVKINKPNLVVFIGEALVGNDAVDQITKFNKALVEESTQTFKPQIDAILLSKFDTVDDKVGTALSLVYSTSKPILYVGVGQKYPNLKQLNVTTVVNSLLS